MVIICQMKYVSQKQVKNHMISLTLKLKATNEQTRKTTKKNSDTDNGVVNYIFKDHSGFCVVAGREVKQRGQVGRLPRCT